MKTIYVLPFLLIVLSANLTLKAQEADADLLKELDSTAKKIDSCLGAGAYQPGFLLAMQARNKAEKLGPDHLAYANALNQLAIFYNIMANYGQSTKLFTQSKNIYEKTGNTKNKSYANTLNNLGNAYLFMDQFDQAEDYYNAAKNIWETISGRESAGYLRCASNLGTIYFYSGQYEKGELLYDEMIRIGQKVLGKKNALYASFLFNLGNIKLKIGQYNEAEALYLEAKQTREETLGKKHPEYANSLSNLASLYQEMGRNTDAEAALLESKSILAQTVGAKHPLYAIALINLGVVYDREKRHEEAEQQFLTAVSIRKAALGPEHHEYGQVLSILAYHYMQGEQFVQAKPLFIESLRINEKTFGKLHPEYEKDLSNLAIAYWHTENGKDSALVLLEEACKLRQILMERSGAYLSENELNQYAKYHAQRMRIDYSYALDHARQQPQAAELAYDNVLFYRGLLLQDAHRIRHLLNAVNTTDSVSTLVQDWEKTKYLLAKAYTTPLKDRPDTDSLEGQVNKLEKTLMRHSGNFAGVRQTVDWHAVQQTLHDQEAAIEFIDFQYCTGPIHDSTLYAALILRPGWPKPRLVYLCEQRQIDTLYQQNNSAKTVSKLYTTRNIRPSQGNLSTDLYPLIWHPMDSLLEGVKTIYYAPSGQLHRIAFHAIPTGKPGEVLGDRYQLHQLGSTRNLVTSQEPNFSGIPPSDALLYGGILYDWNTPIDNQKSTADSSHIALGTLAVLEERKKAGVKVSAGNRGVRGDDGFRYLPGSKKEVLQLEQLLKSKNISTTLLTDSSATEERIKNLGANSPGILHLATHGFFFPNPAQNKEEFSARESHFALLEHPLLRSGLALAGANQTWNTGHPAPGREDGILTAYEIANMNLSGTQLAVLSACETGLGDIQGSEGVYGLQRAFKIAGVKRLIVTLWDVPDKQTAAFMSLFYEKWLGGLDIRTAFYDTQTAMRQRYKDPFVWAAFVLVE